MVIQKRQYKNYLSCLKLFSVPPCLPLFTAAQVNSSTQPTSQLIIQPPVEASPDQTQAQNQNPEVEKPIVYDIRLYNDLMDSIAPEYVSTELVLHCMIEQVHSIATS